MEFSAETSNFFFQLLPRILMGLFFWVMALGLIKDFSFVVELMASRGVPAPSITLPLTISLWVLGGLALILGWQLTLVSLVLMLATLGVTPVIHNFWAASPELMANELQHFMKNIAIAAGLLVLAAPTH